MHIQLYETGVEHLRQTNGMHASYLLHSYFIPILYFAILWASKGPWYPEAGLGPDEGPAWVPGLACLRAPRTLWKPKYEREENKYETSMEQV